MRLFVVSEALIGLPGRRSPGGKGLGLALLMASNVQWNVELPKQLNRHLPVYRGS